MNKPENYNKNDERNRNFKPLFWHSFSYTLVNALLFLVNYFYTPDTWWFLWIMAGWGVGLLFHYASGLSMKKRSKNFPFLNY